MINRSDGSCAISWNSLIIPAQIIRFARFFETIFAHFCLLWNNHRLYIKCPSSFGMVMTWALMWCIAYIGRCSRSCAKIVNDWLGYSYYFARNLKKITKKNSAAIMRAKRLLWTLILSIWTPIWTALLAWSLHMQFAMAFT